MLMLMKHFPPIEFKRYELSQVERGTLGPYGLWYIKLCLGLGKIEDYYMH